LVSGIAQHLGGLPLTHGDGFDARAEDLREIGGVVDGERDDHRRHPVAGGQGDMEQIIGSVEHHDDLQDQRRAPQDGDEDAHQPAQRQKAAPPPQTHQQAQRQGEQQRQEKDQQRVAEACHQLGHKVHKTHIGSCKRSKGTRGGKFPAFLKAVIDCDQPLRAAI